MLKFSPSCIENCKLEQYIRQKFLEKLLVRKIASDFSRRFQLILFFCNFKEINRFKLFKGLLFEKLQPFVYAYSCEKTDFYEKFIKKWA